jgi:serine O-acetyltransferase
MFDHIKQDLNRCGEGFSQRLREVLLNPGTWAVLTYRLRRRMFVSRVPLVIRKSLSPISALLRLWIVIATNIDLAVSSEIGPGLYIPHTGFVVVGTGVRIGRNCTLTQGVTIGHAKGGNRPDNEMPFIGDRVYIGPMAVVVGGIRIGDDALIGAGAITIRSVPPGGVVVGNPARLISTRGSFDLINYTRMEADIDRAAAISKLRPSIEMESSQTAVCM